MDMTAARADVAAVLSALAGPWAVSSYVPADPDGPCLIVGFPRSIVRANLAGHQRVELGIIIVAGTVDQEAAQVLLDAALGTGVGSVASVLDGARMPAWKGQAQVLDAGDIHTADTSGGRALLVATVHIAITG